MGEKYRCALQSAKEIDPEHLDEVRDLGRHRSYTRDGILQGMG